MSILTNQIGVNIAQNAIQVVEINLKDNKIYLENVDEEFFEESIDYDTKETMPKNNWQQLIQKWQEDRKKIKIGLSFSDFATERWTLERDKMTKMLVDKGYEVIAQGANHDPKTQNDQIENMVTQGAKVILIVAEDGAASSIAVDKAKNCLNNLKKV